MGDRFRRPERWREADWEAKASGESPASAIRTAEGMVNADPSVFSQALVDAFFARGRKLFQTNLAPLLTGHGGMGSVLEYGCGAGRIMKSVIEAGHPCAGVDISPTMLQRCRELVPEAGPLYLLDEGGHFAAPSAQAVLVYSYSVLQHIASLSRFVVVIDEMCRVLATGGDLALQVYCEDFTAGPDQPSRTENYEAWSLHYRPTRASPYKRHVQDPWRGIYIGYDQLGRLLAERGVSIERWYYHNPKKPRAIWVIGRKG
jgi:SAM-dependent methyltransferase